MHSPSLQTPSLCVWPKTKIRVRVEFLGRERRRRQALTDQALPAPSLPLEPGVGVVELEAQEPLGPPVYPAGGAADQTLAPVRRVGLVTVLGE